jgi:putative MATE family efflux protein
MEKRYDSIVHKPVSLGLARLAVPAVISSLFSVVFEIVDLFWVGKLGTRPVAALSAASFFVWLLRALALTVATGTLALVSRRAGEGRTRRLLCTVVNSITSTLIVSVALTALLFPVRHALFRWLQIPADVANLSGQYAGAFLSGLAFVFLMVTGEHILRGIGNTRIPMLITGFALLLNMALDPVFIFRLDMGLRGAAWATVLSQLIGCILMMGALRSRFPVLKKGRPDISSRFFKNYFWPIVRIGTPISMSNAAFSVIYMVLSGQIAYFGGAPLAAVGVGHRLESLPYFVALGMSVAVATMVGQYLGAGQPEEARRSVYLALKVASGILLIVSLAFFFIPGRLIGFFVRDPEVIRHGIRYLRIIALAEVFLAFEVILEGAFSGAGDTRPPFLIMFSLTFLRIPLSHLFARTIGLGIDAIWVVISGTTFLKGVLLWIEFRRDRWSRKKI